MRDLHKAQLLNETLLFKCVSKVCRSVLLMGKYLFKVNKKKALDAHCFSAFTVKNTLK